MSDSLNPGQSTSNRGNRRTSSAARAAEALKLRLSGLSYDDIAAQLGYRDKSGAWRAVESELTKVKRERASQVVTLDLARLDQLLTAVWNEAIGGNLAAFDRVLKVLERRARYFDLDGRADATADQLRASEELTFVKALVQIAELRDTAQNRLALAALMEAHRVARGLPLTSIPWDDVALRLDSFDDERNADEYPDLDRG